MEFMEAIARVADTLHPTPFAQPLDDEELWSDSTNKKLPLHVKLESLMEMMFFKYNFKDQKKSIDLPCESLFKNEIE